MGYYNDKYDRKDFHDGWRDRPHHRRPGPKPWYPDREPRPWYPEPWCCPDRRRKFY